MVNQHIGNHGLGILWCGWICHLEFWQKLKMLDPLGTRYLRYSAYEKS